MFGLPIICMVTGYRDRDVINEFLTISDSESFDACAASYSCLGAGPGGPSVALQYELLKTSISDWCMVHRRGLSNIT